MTDERAGDTRIPLFEEALVVDKTHAVTDRVQVRTTTETRDVVVDEILRRGSLEIERIPVDAEVQEAPQVRHEGDLLVIPVVEERLVKRLFVVEELRIRQQTTTEHVSLPTTLRSMHATIEHDQDITTGGETNG